MIDYNIIKLENKQTNKIIIKNISLDYKLDFFMFIDSNNEEYVNIIENKILDFIIDKITKENTYKDFSISLEKINNILKIYNSEKSEDEYLNILLAVLNETDFIYSDIWNPSLYLVKDSNETIEITDKSENKKEFNYISEWNLEHNDILIIWTTRLLEYLSYSDFNDSVSLKIIERINKNIELILASENIAKNIWVLSLKYTNKYLSEEKKSQLIEKTSQLIEKISKIWLLSIDNNFVKILLAYFKIAKEKIEEKSKLAKNLILILWMLIATVFLFIILSWVINTTIENDNSVNNTILYEEAKKYKTIASDNYSNPDQFNLNIEKAEEIIAQLKEKKVFLNDIKILEEQLNTIKKAFNWIEVWDEANDKIIYKIPDEYKNSVVQTLKINWKVYLITKQNIIWPIIAEKKPQINIFEGLKDDEFIDSSIFGVNIILLTKNWKIVEFIQSGNFSFKDVLNQETWEKSSSILSYAQNIYLVWQNKTQIFKHAQKWNSFAQAEPYLKNEDSKSIWTILSIAIDWWFYILKNDLSIVKFFTNPYRLETITLNNLPKNYSASNKTSKIKVIARKDLNYVYLLLDNKIWILKPNTKLYTEVKSLQYLWQIEASQNKIIDFFVENDWKISILNNNWIYNISFNENDWKILVNN